MALVERVMVMTRYGDLMVGVRGERDDRDIGAEVKMSVASYVGGIVDTLLILIQ